MSVLIKSTIAQKLRQATVIFGLMVTSVAWAGTVSVSNYPLSLLSNAVTKGTPPAGVLLGAGDVGHHGSLSPSGVKQIKDSQFVVWFGEELEQNLVNTLKSAPNAISLYRFDAFRRLPLREIDGTPKPNTLDPHIWLDPSNAKAIVRALAVIHSHADPKNATLYKKNAQHFAERMNQAVKAVSGEPVKPYWAYHDAYQYLENHAKLSFAGALTPDHHLAPKATQLKNLSTNRPHTHMCLVSQGTVSSGIVSKLGGVNVVVAQEDMSDGVDFVEVWQDLVRQVRAC